MDLRTTNTWTEIIWNQSILQKCQELTTLISLASIEELKNNYQPIVDHIFGFTGGGGWGLRTTTRQAAPKETDALCRFLGPQGPLIELAYRLLGDQTLKFQFPISCLHVSVERQIRRCDVTPFLANKLVYLGNGAPPKSLLLNSFEYYFFLFAYIQLKSCAESSSYLIGWGNIADTVYTFLLDEYLAYFLPCDGNGVPSIQFAFRQIPDTSFTATHLVPRSPLTTLAPGVPDKSRPKLFKSLVFQDQLAGSVHTQREPLFYSAIPAIQKETWRTETVINTFMLIWMNIDAPQDPCNLQQQFESALPSVELVKSIRSFVRHFHYFVYCINNHVMHPLEDVKRGTFPIFQKKLYVVLRYLLARWPLDNSFRIVYETWLSYIQPWRYTKHDRYDRSRKNKEQEGCHLDSRWYNFILENILFYTYLFQQMLPRFERVELEAIRNAHMLLRVSKVFNSYDNLKIMLKDVERTLQADNPKIGPGGDSPIYLHSPSKASNMSSLRNAGNTFSLENSTSGITIAQVHHHMRELENPNFDYVPLFSIKNQERILNLMKLICEAKEILIHLLRESEHKSQSQKSVSLLDRMFSKNATSTVSNEQTLTNERRKTIQHLDGSLTHLSNFFDLARPEVTFDGDTFGTGGDYSSESGQHNSMSFSQLRTSSSTPDQLYSPGKYSPKLIKPMGNPDLAPRKSDEQAFLIPFLIALSRFLNRTVLPLVESFYFQESWKGKIVRAVLCKPVLYTELVKRGPGQVLRIRKYLPPRINLRFMGSTYFAATVLGIFLLGALYGVSGTGWIFWPIVAYVLYIVLRASTEPRHYLQELRTEFTECTDTPDVEFYPFPQLNDSGGTYFDD